MTTIVTRTETQTDGTAAKGSELTWSEVDTNFINLNDDKVEVSGAIVFAAKAGEALTKGDVVYVSGVSGNEPVVSKADADDASKMPAFGLAEADASLNAAVNVVTFGTLYDLDTSAFSAGDTVYVSTTAGGLTATKPAGESSLLQNLGLVVRSHASAGSIKVGGAGRTNAVPNLNDGNVFIGNASNQAETRALVEADISDFGTYIGLTDLSVTTNAVGTAALSYNNTSGAFSYTPPDLSSYLTSYTETDTLDSVTGRGATTTNAVTVGNLTSTGIDDNATSTAITIDSSQNVGIGIAPTTDLDVYRSTTTASTIRARNDSVSVYMEANNGYSYLNTFSNHPMLFGTNNAERMRIDASGSVGIGTSTPQNRFVVSDGDQGFEINPNVTNEVRLNAYDRTNSVFRPLAAQCESFIVKPNGTESMRVTSDGTLCVGDEDPDHNGPSSKLYVCSEVNNTGVSNNTNIPDIFVGASSTGGGSGAGGEIRFGSRVYGTSGFAAFKGFITDGTANYNLGHLDLNMRANNTSASMTRRFRFEYDGDFHADGDVIAYSTTVSDASLKDDVETIDSALDKVSNLRGVTYTWNAGSREGKRDLGVIAQEVEAVIPEIVHEHEMPLLDGETYKTVDYEKLTAVLIEAVKELKAEVEALKNGASV